MPRGLEFGCPWLAAPLLAYSKRSHPTYPLDVAPNFPVSGEISLAVLAVVRVLGTFVSGSQACS